MGAALKLQEHEFDEVFTNISKLYDHAEDILRAAYEENVSDRNKFVNLIEGLVGQIEESANTIASNFSETVEKGKEPTADVKSRITLALKKVLSSIEEYKKYANLPQN